MADENTFPIGLGAGPGLSDPPLPFTRGHLYKAARHRDRSTVKVYDRRECNPDKGGFRFDFYTYKLLGEP